MANKNQTSFNLMTMYYQEDKMKSRSIGRCENLTKGPLYTSNKQGAV